MRPRLPNDRPDQISLPARAGSGRTGLLFADLSRTLARQLDSPNPDDPLLSSSLTSSGICPLDILSLFPRERRLAVLREGPGRDDRVRAAAVRTARILFGLDAASEKTLEQWDRRTQEIREHFLTAEGTGLLAFTRHMLSGGPPDHPERFLTERTCWNGFELLEVIGRGGTSLAFRAVKNGCLCVLKVPISGRTGRFRRETRLLKRFRHRNLPMLPESSTGKQPYCVMELLRTGSGVGLSADPSGFRKALDYLHERRILHGDIRRSNLGSRPDGTAVLIDLSHARRARTPGEAAEEMYELNQLLKKECAR